MSITYIAFIECVLHPFGHWIRDYRRPDSVRDNADRYIPKGIHAELRLVDIKQDRRYFKFNNHEAVVRIVNNVVIFDDQDAEELAIDESKQFPKKKRKDE